VDAEAPPPARLRLSQDHRARAQHREELGKKQVTLLEVNTTLTQAVHDLSQQIEKLVSTRS
jgi:hypothetical protein